MCAVLIIPLVPSKMARVSSSFVDGVSCGSERREDSIMVTMKRVSSTLSTQFVDDNAQVVHYDVRIRCNGSALLEFTEHNMFAHKRDAEELFITGLNDGRIYKIVACMIPTLAQHDVMVQRTWDYHCNNHPTQTPSAMKSPPVKGEMIPGNTEINPENWREGFTASLFFYDTTTHETIIIWECDHIHKTGEYGGAIAAETCAATFAKEQGISVG